MIASYTKPEGSRKYFGALLVGFYEDKNLKFAGRVGTGFWVIKDTTGVDLPRPLGRRSTRRVLSSSRKSLKR